MRHRIVRLQRNRTVELLVRQPQPLERVDRLVAVRIQIQLPCLLVGNECLHVLDARGAHQRALLVVEQYVERSGHVLGDVQLHGETVLQRAVVGMRPKVVTVAGADQLGGDACTLALAAHAAFEHGGHAQRLADLAQVLVLALELERRGATHHLQAIDARQRVQDLLGQAIGEELVFRVGRHVDEGQHRDRALDLRRACYGLSIRGRGARCRCQPRRLALRRQHELVHREIGQRQRQHRDDHAVHALRGLRRNRLARQHIVIAFQAGRRQFEYPGEHHRNEEADRQHAYQRLHHPGRRFEHGQQGRRHLRHQPRTDQVQPGHADDVAAFQFGEETHSGGSGFPRASMSFRSGL